MKTKLYLLQLLLNMFFFAFFLIFYFEDLCERVFFCKTKATNYTTLNLELLPNQSNTTVLLERESKPELKYVGVEPQLDNVGSDTDSVFQATLTKWTQDFIWNHQNPAECPSDHSRYIVTHGWQSGLGSEMHVTGTHLAYAIENNLIMLWGRQSCTNYISSDCLAGCSCLFLPLSHCPQQQEALLNPNVGFAQISGADYHPWIPSIFKEPLKKERPLLTENQIRYWWRGQSVAYLMRFNKATVLHLKQLRFDPQLWYTTSSYGFVNKTDGTNILFPPGTINIHIRRGDKYKEMRLIENDVYIEAFEKMVSVMPLHFSSKSVFLSGDEENDIQFCKTKLEEKNFHVIYSRIPRWPNGYFIEMIFEDEHIRNNKQLYALYHLFQLQMSLEADGWIGTRASNWCRLIDELRCIWVSKCEMPFVEVGNTQGDDYNW